MGEDLGGGVVVEEGVEPIPHGVLARELEGNLISAGLLSALIAQRQQGFHEFWLVVGQFVLALWFRGVDDSPRGQHEDHGIQSSVGIGDGAATHARGVVSEDAAQGACH